MADWCSALRRGSTSYVYPEDVLPNVRRLAGLVQDIEWVVFEVSYGLPGPGVIAEMARLGREYGHSYTVHLPLDPALAAEDEEARRAAVEVARRVIDAARPLDPWAYVVHLEPSPPAPLPGSGRAVGGEGARSGRGSEGERRAPPGTAESSAPAQSPLTLPSPLEGRGQGAWLDRAAESLTALGQEAGGLELLAVENLPGYPPEQLWPLLERLPVSLCLDVGHLLGQGRDPRPLLADRLGRIRALHLHGVEDGRDHRDLRAMDQGLLLELLGTLWRERYGGVVTVECFAAQAFFDSWDLVEGLWRRIQRGYA